MTYTVTYMTYTVTYMTVTYMTVTYMTTNMMKKRSKRQLCPIIAFLLFACVLDRFGLVGQVWLGGFGLVLDGLVVKRASSAAARDTFRLLRA